MRVLKGHQDTIRCLSYSPDGQLLAAGDEHGEVRLWRLPGGEPADVVDLDRGSVECLAFAPTGKHLVIGLPDELVRWDLTKNDRDHLVPGHEGGTRGLAWSPDGKTLATCGWDHNVRLWTPTLHPMAEAIAVPEPITALGWDARQRLTLAGNAGVLLVVSATDKRPLVHTRHSRGLFSLALSPDGTLGATGDDRGDILLWRSSDLTVYGTLHGHAWTVYGLAFTSDGQHLVSGSADGTVKLWEVRTGRLVETYRWHSRWVTSLAISPDGMTAAAGSSDRTIVLWDLADG